MIPRTARKKTISNQKGNPSQRKLVALVCSDGMELKSQQDRSRSQSKI